MRYLLDTNTFIYIKNHRPAQVIERFSAAQPGYVFISVITYGELYRGCEKSDFKARNHRQLNFLISQIPVMSLPENAGAEYGHILSHLEKSGQIIGANDLWIAAHALALDFTLITNNIREFERVPGLRLENWV